MFPLEKPYKLLYSINSLIICLREEVLEVRTSAISVEHLLINCGQVNPNQEFISHSIQALVAFLTRPEMSESLEDSHLKLIFACNFVECLQLALTGKQNPKLSVKVTTTHSLS
jgi:ubiquitin carboxyl-terminal hydrolase 34